MPGEPTDLDDTTHDRLLGGRIRFEQPAHGYRAAVDGLLLAAFAGRASRMAADLGAGAGMVTLAMLAQQRAAHVVSIEQDPQMAGYLTRNLAANGLTERATVLVADVLSAAHGRRGSAELVVANPPFYTPGQVTPALHPRARAARMGDENGALGTFLRAAREILGRGGRACFVWPAADLEALMLVAPRTGLHAKRARFVHPLPSRPAVRVMVDFKPGARGGLTIEPPLYLFDRPGVPSAEVLAATGRDDPAEPTRTWDGAQD